MTIENILKLQDLKEQTRMQFKERVTRDNKYDVSCEMAALSNSHGGYIVVGIDDKTGHMNPISYDTFMNFFTRNLRNVQVEKEFYSLGKLEIPYAALVEFTVNALVHRSLNWKAPIRIFIFDDRVEIHSPGELPNGLTVEDIMKGTSMPRNKFLFTNANYLLPHTGAGTGIIRAMEDKPDVTFENHDSAHEFVIVMHRIMNQETNLVKPVRVLLRGSQKDIVYFCSEPRTAKEILDRISVSVQTRTRKNTSCHWLRWAFWK